MVSKLVAFLTLAVLTLSIGSRAEAQTANYRTYFTFSAPVTLPGQTLPAGKYIFRLADPDGSRKVINVLSGDGRRSLAMLHSIPNQATKPPKDAEIGSWKLMRKSRRRSRRGGTRARRSATNSSIRGSRPSSWQSRRRIPILTTAKDTTDFKNADLSRITGSGVPAAVTVSEKPAPAEARGRAQQADVAPQGSSSASAARAGSASR